MTKTITEKDLTLKDLSLINAIQKNKSIDVFKTSFMLSKHRSKKSYDNTFHTWDVAVDLMNLLDDDNTPLSASIDCFRFDKAIKGNVSKEVIMGEVYSLIFYSII